MVNHSGFIAIVGRPNVGKSSILNALVGQKVAIVSNKPQTTRNRILAVLTEDTAQAVFMDTPGLHRPRTKLGEYMMKAASDAQSEVDVVLLVVEPTGEAGTTEQNVIEHAKESGSSIILAVNKIDISSKENVAKTIAAYAEIADFTAVIPVSARKNDGIDILKKEIINLLPEGPQYFPEDTLTDQPEKQLAAEILREKSLQILRDEVPHGIAVEIESFKEGKTKEKEDIIRISAALYCEKESHKGIIIGKKGETLKKISSFARKDMEQVFDCHVFLEVFVKVKENWRDSDFLLKNFGYNS
ncbi:MAG: GTPase Era [Bacillota bacterium]|nr:GTPase Era [Bacillota bacterium]